MNNELIKYVTGDVVPKGPEKKVARQARKIYDEVRLTGLKVDGQVALTGHIMEQLVQLDERRRELAGDDPITNAMLADVEINAVRKLKSIQNGMFNDWNL